MFLGAMGLGVGSLVKKDTVAGSPTCAFVTPGLMAATAMQVAAGESLWPIMAGTKWMRTFHGMVATPIGPGDVFLGVLAVDRRPARRGRLDLPRHRRAVRRRRLVVGPARGPGHRARRALLRGTARRVRGDPGHRLPLPDHHAARDVPLFLFSGTFFPVDQLPDWLQPFGWLSPLWHGVELCRARPPARSTAAGRRQRGDPHRAPRGHGVGRPHLRGSWRRDHATATSARRLRRPRRYLPARSVRRRRSSSGTLAYRRLWGIFLTGFVEPLLFLCRSGSASGRSSAG